jgi:hypothetical protein
MGLVTRSSTSLADAPGICADVDHQYDDQSSSSLGSISTAHTERDRSGDDEVGEFIKREQFSCQSNALHLRSRKVICGPHLSIHQHDPVPIVQSQDSGVAILPP